MSKKKLVLFVLLMLALVVFFAMPMTAIADGNGGNTQGTAIHLKNNSAEGIQEVTVYYKTGDPVSLSKRGNNWVASDDGNRVLDDVDYIIVKIQGLGDVNYDYISQHSPDDDFGPQGHQEIEPMEFSLENNGNGNGGSVNFWLNYLPGAEMGSITVNKSFSDDSEDEVDFSLYFDDEEVASGTTSGQTITFSDLPPGTYTLVEDNVPDGYVTVIEGGDSVLVEEDTETIVYVTNDKIETLTINKEITDTENDSEELFTFNIYKSTGEDNWELVDTVEASEAESVTVELEPGEYKVVEVDKDGYHIDPAYPDDGEQLVTIDEDATEELTFHNAEDEMGTLVINKQITNTEEDTSDEFTFDIYVSTGDDSWEYVDTVTASEEDAAELELAPGEYKVVEQAKEGYEFANGQSAPYEQTATVIDDETTELTFENTKTIATLTINKEITNIDDDVDKEFSFDIYVKKHTLLGGWWKYLNTVNASEIDSKTVNLDPGEYKVIEKNKNGYKIDTNYDDGTQFVTVEQGGTYDMTFHNTQESYTLKIKKDILSIDDNSKVFTFDVYEWDDGEAGDLIAENVEASEGNPGVVDGLKAGKYLVIEDTADGYVSMDGIYFDTSKIVEIKNGNKEVTFYNAILDTRSLTIYKDVTGNEGGDTTLFTFDIYRDDDGYIGDIVALNVTASEVVPFILEGLTPVGNYYWVCEDAADGYTCENDAIKVWVGKFKPYKGYEGPWNSVTFYNDPETTYDLTINKDVRGSYEADREDDASFEFHVYHWLYEEDQDPSQGEGERGDEVGNGDGYTASESDSATVSWLTAGWYEIAEIDDATDAYKPEITIDPDVTSHWVYVGPQQISTVYICCPPSPTSEYSVTFINFYDPATLTIYKDVPNEYKSEELFEFTISGDNLEEDIVVEASEVSPSETVILAPGFYTVTETRKDGYVTTEYSYDVEIAANEHKKITFTNYLAGEITINKVVDNYESEADFDFEIWSMNEHEEWVHIKTVHASEVDAYIGMLPIGYYMIIERDEESDNYYPVSVEDDNNSESTIYPDEDDALMIYVSIMDGEPVSVTFNNGRYEDEPEDGYLRIEKDVPNVNNSDVYFTFNIYNEDDELINTVEASEVDSYTLELDPGTYTVIEEGRSGYTQRDADQTVIIEAGAEETLTFVNTRRTHEPHDPDDPDEPDGPDEPEYEDEEGTPYNPPVIEEPVEEPVVEEVEEEIPAAPIPDTDGSASYLIIVLGLALIAFGSSKIIKAYKAK